MVSTVLVLALNAGISSSIGVSLKCGIGTSLVETGTVLDKGRSGRPKHLRKTSIV